MLVLAMNLITMTMFRAIFFVHTMAALKRGVRADWT